MGGFGSAVLEAAAEMRLDTRNLHRIGIPDVFVEHGDRAELLAEINLDAQAWPTYAGKLQSQMVRSNGRIPQWHRRRHRAVVIDSTIPWRFPCLLP